MIPLVVFGAGEIAEVAAFYFRHDSAFDVQAFTVDGEFVKQDTLDGRPVVPFEELATAYSPDRCKAFVAISYQRLNVLRAEKCQALRGLGYQLVSYISSRASVYPDLTHGDNCFILEDNTIQPFVKIGDNVTLWSGNHLGHHARIGNHCFLTSHVVVSGAVEIGDYSFVGVNSTLRDHIRVGRSNIIGAGSLILEDTPDHAVYAPRGTEKSRVPSNRLKRI